MLNKKCIIIKVEGSANIGLGHIYRINNLINSLKKKNKIVIFTKKNQFGYKFFKNKLKVCGYAKNELISFKNLCFKEKPEFFLFDELKVSSKIISFIKKQKTKSIFLDCKNVKPSKYLICVDTFIKKKNK